MHRRNAFTIIELMVTIAIIGLLLAAAGLGIARSRVTSRDSKRVSDILLMASMFDQQALANRGTYPAASGPTNPVILNSTTNTSNFTPALDLSSFANHMLPSDPSPANPSCSTTIDFRCGYVYTNRSTGANTLLTRSQGTYTTQYEYVLEVGLEGDRFSDDQSVTAGPAGTLGSANSARTQYLYFGKACGTGSGNSTNTCSIP